MVCMENFQPLLQHVVQKLKQEKVKLLNFLEVTIKRRVGGHHLKMSGVRVIHKIEAES